MNTSRATALTAALALGLAACSVGTGEIRDVPDDAETTIVDESPAPDRELPDGDDNTVPPEGDELGTDDGVE